MLNRVLPLLFPRSRYRRSAVALVAVPLLVAGCAASSTVSAPVSSSPVGASPSSAAATPMAGSLQVPMAPAPPACGEGSALLASMSTRDKLAQLLTLLQKLPAAA